MSFIEGPDRAQVSLLPPSIEDYVAPDALVRVVDLFVDSLDLTELGFGRTVAAVTGRPGFRPGDMLRLYIWGYLDQVRSSRMLERACQIASATLAIRSPNLNAASVNTLVQLMVYQPAWPGHLKLSLVTCPVALYKAVEPARRGTSSNLINPETGNRINMKPKDPELGEVNRADLVKGYEVDKGL